jgi:AcrR family transcriptional regulator
MQPHRIWRSTLSRQTERQQRRRRIAEAVCSLADERGMDGVTLRDVAARADVSMGAVQRCFGTKDEMLLFALDHISEQVTERITKADDLTRVATEIALLDPAYQHDARVWLAFAARAAVSPPLADVLRRNYELIEVKLERLISALGVTDAPAQTRALLALADGLTTHMLIGYLSHDAATGILQSHLDRLTAGTHSSAR